MKGSPILSRALILGSALLLGCTDRLGTNPAQSGGGNVLEALPVTAATAAAAAEFAIQDTVVVPAVCTGDVLVNCASGTPGTAVRLKVDQVGAVVATPSGENSFSFTGNFAVTSLQSIPVSSTGITCGVTVNTAPGISPTVAITGTATFVSHTNDAVINRVNVTGTASGLEADDVTIAGGTGCATASAMRSFLVTSLQNSIQSNAAVCGAVGPATFRACPITVVVPSRSR